MLVQQKLSMTMIQSNPRRFVRFLGKDISFREAMLYINRYSYFLQNAIGHKKRVGVFMSHSPHIYYSFFALANTVNTMVPLQVNWSDAQIAEAIKELKLDFLLITENQEKRLKALFKFERIKLPMLVVDKRRFGEFDPAFHLSVGLSAGDGDAILVLPTEGTAGHRKWVNYTHVMLEAQCLALKHGYKLNAMDTVFAYKLDPLHPAAFLHSGIIPLLNGASVLLSDVVDMNDLAKEMKDAKVTRMVLCGTNLSEFMESVAAHDQKMSWLKSITPIKGVVTEHVRTIAQNYFKDLALLLNYGTVESGFSVTMTPREEPTAEHFYGPPLPGVNLRLIDRAGADIKLNSGKVGEIVVSGKVCGRQYINAAEEQKLTFRGASFFTGDLGRMTKEGDLEFVGRKDFAPDDRDHQYYLDPRKDVDQIKKLPGILDAIFMQMKSRLGRETRILVIKKAHQATAEAVNLTEFAQRQFPAAVAPEHVITLEEFPYDAYGYINRIQLFHMLNGSF